ncbi:hypothetical protein TSOC_003493 [Tetrabaena socialis]|uniref:Uncharacterized protein n=1 Tax=Tetrabaena socialis TaxID=47790 RepID=A0A2J8ABF3_9CHLO|nr:hypothetical protein TSOC_003493 [Tetrabaena socialis]|eukprot:PNH09851.1 hypothetical protein TSOC_003493 [Tetrabaena socialis]
MKALSLHGPWAFYERKAAENECRIGDLEAEVRRLRLAGDDLQTKLALAEGDKKRLAESDLPALRSGKERAEGIIDSLQAEVARLRQERSEEQSALTGQLGSVTSELQRLSADNALLRSELAKTVHQKQLTSSKLEQIRRKLGLTESEAKAFIQELDDARAASKGFREENTQLAADNTHLKQQASNCNRGPRRGHGGSHTYVESRSQHCMTLIGENKRLLEQVADLRTQLNKQQGELWQVKTEQTNSAAAVRQLQQATSSSSKVVVREWPQPQQQPQARAASASAGGRAPSSTARASSGGGASANQVGG